MEAAGIAPVAHLKEVIRHMALRNMHSGAVGRASGLRGNSGARRKVATPDAFCQGRGDGPGAGQYLRLLA